MLEFEKINPALYAEQAYLDYTMDVVSHRAIPKLRDGQKPVQRRVLFAMRELGITADKEPTKSARIVGDIIGKYHPHGDTSVYEALVKMSQDFYLRYPLINGQGNFGTRDGDSAAAMRYTEARFSPIAELLLSELNMGACDFIPNYDQLLVEPSVLPSRLNFMLMNGTFGIAVALATKIPAHNIRNVTDATIHQIKNPNCTVAELVEHLIAPDFPTGGQIISSKEEIIKAYETGSGGFTVRCRWKVEKLAKGHWQIVIYELPPSCSSSSLMEKIGIIEKPKLAKEKNGKLKKPTQKQINDKQLLLNYVAKPRDESSGKEGIRVVLEPRSSRENPEKMMDALYKLLDLEESFKMNMVAIGNDNKAVSKNLKDLVSEWVDFRIFTLNKRTQFSLDKALKRIHVLEGRKIAYDHIDEIIEIIKEEEKPKEVLMERFSLSETQATDILDIRLRQLANIELDSIVKDLNSLYIERDKYEVLLASKTKMKNLMIKEMEQDTKKFEDERKTLVQESEKSIVNASESIIDEKVTIVLTNQGWLTSRKGHDIETELIQLKDGDSIFKVVEGRTAQPICLFADSGKTYNLRAINILGGKNMIHVNSLIEANNSSIIDMLFLKEGKKYLVGSTDGYGFLSTCENLLTKNKAGKVFFNVKDGSTIYPLMDIEEYKYITCFTEDNRILSYLLEEVKELPKGKGVQLMKTPTKINLKGYILHSSDILEVDTKTITKKVNIIDDGIFNKRALRGVHIKEGITSVTEIV
jgi:topoisomerase-4 subunit A